MTTLVWNLEENATRRHLLAEALLQLPEERRAQVLEAAEAAGVSDGHHHDLGEVNAAIDALAASERAKGDMRAVYRILAEAEAAGRRALYPHERRRHPPLRAALRRVATRSAAPRRSASSECFT